MTKQPLNTRWIKLNIARFASLIVTVISGWMLVQLAGTLLRPSVTYSDPGVTPMPPTLTPDMLPYALMGIGSLLAMFIVVLSAFVGSIVAFVLISKKLQQKPASKKK